MEVESENPSQYRLKYRIINEAALFLIIRGGGGGSGKPGKQEPSSPGYLNEHQATMVGNSCETRQG